MAQVRDKILPVETIVNELDVYADVRESMLTRFSQHHNDAGHPLKCRSEQNAFREATDRMENRTSNLAPLAITTPDKLKAVRYPEIRARLGDIRDARADLMIRIDDTLKLTPPQVADLKEQLSAMLALINGVDALAGAELSILQDEITSLAQWAKAAAPIAETPPTIDQEMLGLADVGIKAAKAFKK